MVYVVSFNPKIEKYLDEITIVVQVVIDFAQL